MRRTDEERLVWAAGDGDLESVRDLLDGHTYVNYKGKDGATPLHSAASYGHLDIVQELLAHGASVNVADNDGATPLHLAAENGCLDVVRELLAHRALVDAANNDGATPLHLAAENGCLDVVRELLAHRALVDAANNNGRTALHEASRYEHFDIMKELVARGASVDVIDRDEGCTPLHWASIRGQLDVVQELLTLGASVNLPDRCGWTALHLASLNGHLDVVKRLLDHRASIDATPKDDDGWTALHGASKFGHLNVIKELLERGASVNATDSRGNTALHYALLRRHMDIVKELLAHKISVNIADKDGITVLHLATGFGDTDIAKELLARGASVDATLDDGGTALHLASREGHLDIMKELLVCKASVNTATKYGETALHFASSQGQLEILKGLLDAGANANLKNKDGKTARDLGSDEVKALFDEYFPSKIWSPPPLVIYSITSATDLIRKTLGHIKGRTSDLIAIGSTVLNLSLEAKIHRQEVLVIGVLVADILRHATHQDSASEQQALLSLLKNIQTSFETNITAFQLWSLHVNARSFENISKTISPLKKELIKEAQNFKINSNIQVLGSAKEELRHDLAKMMDKLENIDKCLEIVQELPDHRQTDALDELLIQVQRGLEYYKCQVAFGNIQESIDFEHEVKLFRDKVCSAIHENGQARKISNGLQLETIEPWMLSSDEVDFEPKDINTALGKGGFATVFKGTCYGQAVAVKRFDNIVNMDSVGLEKMIAKEINGWKDVCHEPYILNLVGVCTKSPTPILVSELCRTNIRRYIRHRPETLLPLVYQFAGGLACIHKANIIHRDLKGDNVLITYQDTVAIADFGLSRSATSLENTKTSVKRAGTLNWMSPEQYFLPRSVTAKSDVWSFGMTLWEILCDDTPLRECSEYEFRDEIYQSEVDRPKKPEEMNPALEPLWTLITKCWRLKPKARPSSEEIVEYLKNEFASQLEGL